MNNEQCTGESTTANVRFKTPLIDFMPGISAMAATTKTLVTHSTIIQVQQT